MNTISSVLQNFQSRLKELSPDTALKYRRTLSDFDCFLTGHSLTLESLTPGDIADWAAELLRQGLSPATAAQRLTMLNSIFKTVAPDGESILGNYPRQLAREIESPAFTLPPLLKAGVIDRNLANLRTTAKPSNLHNPYRDMLLFSILAGALPLKDIISLKKEALTHYSGAARQILERNAAPRRRFIFDLRQAYLTPRQIAASVSEELMRRYPFLTPGGKTPFDDLSGSLWAALAIRSGATASEVAACLRRPAPYAIPGFCSGNEKSAERREEWMRAVDQLLAHTPKWYAMHLRKGVTYEEIRKEIHDKVRPLPELFYPVEIIRKKQRGKTTVTEQPYISRIVFFRSQPENVLPMFAEIGDKAWCFRVFNSPDSPYAIIPEADMQRFQNAIGIFTAATDLYPLGTLTPRPGEKVILIQAGYANREASVEEILAPGTPLPSNPTTPSSSPELDPLSTDITPLLVRIKLTTDYGYEWRTTVDARQLLPLTAAN